MLKNNISLTTAFALAMAISLVANDTSMGQSQSIVKRAAVPSMQVSSRSTIQDPIDDQPSSSDQFQNQLDLELQNRMDEDDQDAAPKRQAFGSWPRKGIRAINADISETSSKVPEDRSGQLLRSGGSQWNSFNASPKVFAWVAPDIRYQPLYFEDVALERYGQTTGPYRQSALSAVHMFKSFVLLPHQMRHDAPASCDSPLGFCRPGNPVPYTIQRSYFGQPQR